MWLAPPLGEDVIQVAGVVDQAGAGGGLRPQRLDRSETWIAPIPRSPSKCRR